MKNEQLKKQAYIMKQKALEMVLDEKTNVTHLDHIYKMLEISEMITEIVKEEVEEVEDKIKDEFMGAESYYKDYLETHDADYLQMMYDEITHARKLLMLRQASEGDTAYSDSMQGWLDDLLERYYKYKS